MSSSIFQAVDDRRRQYRNGARAVVMSKVAGAASPMSTYGAGQINQLDLGLGMDSGAAKHAEQFRYFRDWVYTAIQPLALRMSGQQFFVGSLEANAELRMQKALSRLEPNQPAASHSLAARLFTAKESLPDCFKSMGERIDPIDNHPFLDVMANPNSIMVGWQLVYLLGASLKITGETLWWIDDHEVDPLTGKTRWQIWPIPAHWATPVHTKEKLFAYWKVRSPRMTQAVDVPGEKTSYFYLPDPADPLSSLSAITAQARSISTDDQLQNAQYHMLKDGLRPDMVLIAGELPDANGKPGMKPTFTPDQRTQLIEAVKLAYRGPSRQGEPLILDGLIKDAKPYSRSPQEMGFTESGSVTKNRIMLGLGMNSIAAGEVEGVNRASSAMADEHVCYNQINPLGALISQVLTVRVAPLFARPGEKLVIWMDPARPRDQEITLKKWMGCKRSVTPNDERTVLLNLPPLDDEYADTPYYKIPPVKIPGAEGDGPDGKPGKPKPPANRAKPAGRRNSAGQSGHVQSNSRGRDTLAGGRKPRGSRKPKPPATGS